MSKLTAYPLKKMQVIALASCKRALASTLRTNYWIKRTFIFGLTFKTCYMLEQFYNYKFEAHAGLYSSGHRDVLLHGEAFLRSSTFCNL